MTKKKSNPGPLHDACRLREFDEVARRVSQTNVNSKDEDGQTPLICSCQSADTRIAELLLNHGADVRIADSHGMTALHWASFKAKQPQLVELLIRSGADPDAVAHEGLTPLHYAAILGFDLNAKALLNAGADPRKTFRGLDARALAAKYKHPKVSKLFQ